MRKDMTVIAAVAVLVTSPAVEAAEPDTTEGDQVATVFLNGASIDGAAALADLRKRADAGNVDAQYQLGQAYRTGEGVPVDPAEAQSWLRKAALQGDVRAEAQLGLMLFSSPRRADSFPWLEKAAAKGEPRAQYVLGTALFNGDGVAKDWPRAYALMRRASANGIGPATRSLVTMETYLTVADKLAGVALASKIAAAETLSPAPRLPAPAKAAPAGVAAAPAPARAPRIMSARSWRIQLGAFGEENAAQTLWSEMADTPALRAKTPLYSEANGLTRLQVGPFPDKAAASRACAALKESGNDCFLVPS